MKKDVKEICEELVKNKDEWINHILIDECDNIDRAVGLVVEESYKTIIKNIDIQDGYYFRVIGEDFYCGTNFEYLSIVQKSDNLFIFYGYGGHKWAIQKKEK